MLGKKEFNVKYKPKEEISRIRYSKHQAKKVSLVAVNRIVRFNRTFFFFSWMENELASLSFFANTALDGAAPCRIFRSTVIFTRVVAPQWILLLPRLLTISKPSRHRGFDPSPPYLIPCYSLFDSHCSKSLHRDPLLCFFIRIYQFVSTRSTIVTLLLIIIQTR